MNTDVRTPFEDLAEPLNEARPKQEHPTKEKKHGTAWNKISDYIELHIQPGWRLKRVTQINGEKF